MHVGVGAFVVAATAITVGTMVQGSVGFGLNLLAAPFVAIVVPKALPATLVLVAFPLAVTLLVREHPHLHRSALPWMVRGAVPGTVLGLLIVGHVSGADLAIVVGAITLVGVALSVLSPPIKVNAGDVAGRRVRVEHVRDRVVGRRAAGGAAVPAPPGAGGSLDAERLLRVERADVDRRLRASPATSRSTRCDSRRSCIPFMVGGFWISRHLHGRIDRGWLRPAVLALSAAAGLVAILRAVV